ncbi:MAG: IS110 family transposase [Eubacterium sp.]|nr:IS110 family transposase [Eubacterium sp.]
MIRKLCEAGSIELEVILNFLHGTARKKLDVIRQAVNGRMDGHDRAFLSMLARNYGQSLKEIEDVEKEIYDCAEKYGPSIALLETIPGISGMTAVTMVSKLGTNLSMFPTSGHLCSWAGGFRGITRAPERRNRTV